MREEAGSRTRFIEGEGRSGHRGWRESSLPFKDKLYTGQREQAAINLWSAAFVPSFPASMLKCCWPLVASRRPFIVFVDEDNAPSVGYSGHATCGGLFLTLEQHFAYAVGQRSRWTQPTGETSGVPFSHLHHHRFISYSLLWVFECVVNTFSDKNTLIL